MQHVAPISPQYTAIPRGVVRVLGNRVANRYDHWRHLASDNRITEYLPSFTSFDVNATSGSSLMPIIDNATATISWLTVIISAHERK